MASGSRGGAVGRSGANVNGGSGANVNGGSGADGGNGTTGGSNGSGNGCTYKDFTACKPREFDGKDGTLAYTQWMEKTEAVIDISDCAADRRVKYVAGSLTDHYDTILLIQVPTIASCLSDSSP